MAGDNWFLRSSLGSAAESALLGFFFFKQKTAYEIGVRLVGSEMCIRDSARGDFHPDSDIDIMILLDITDLDLKEYNIKLSYMTFDFNLDHDLDIKPIAKNEEHFKKWLDNYPFYANINREGVVLYGAA